MHPGPAMGNGEVDQAEAVEDTNKNYKRTLPKETVEDNTEGGKKPKNDAKNHDESGHGHIAVTKVAGNVYQICYNLNNFEN